MSSIVWITLINKGYVNFTKNFLESMKRNNCIFSLIIYCLDNESIVALQGYTNVTCVSANPFIRGLMNKNLTIWKSIEYKRIVFSKLDAIKYTMDLPEFKGSCVGYIDTDIILFKDPTPIMIKALSDNPDAIVISQCDEDTLQCSNINKCPNICSGVIVFRQSFITKSLLQYSERDIITNLTDQHFLTEQFKKLNVNHVTIDKNVFMNGFFPGVKMDGHVLKIPDEAVLLHYNYMIGSYKEYFMKKNKMWFL
ncbi:MAG: hypothetical protein EB127_05615 [Alphaproteobacteria bacterium]|nr:hypothetical protein [Alphaproteobacteria bacterium]